VQGYWLPVDTEPVLPNKDAGFILTSDILTLLILSFKYLYRESHNYVTFFFFRRGSWRPIGHMRPSSPLLDSVRDNFEDYECLAKDFTRVFLNSENNLSINGHLFDVTFLVGQSKQKIKFVGVRAILSVRSR